MGLALPIWVGSASRLRARPSSTGFYHFRLPVVLAGRVSWPWPRAYRNALWALGGVADRVQDFEQVYDWLAAFLRRSGSSGAICSILFIGQIGRVALGFLYEVGHLATIRSGIGVSLMNSGR